jgi:hypothetical protein
VNWTALPHSGQAARRSIDRAERSGRRVAQEQRKWLIPLGRTGYAANGLGYIVVGALAAQAPFSAGGDTTDTGGALAHIMQAPFGRLLVGLVSAGLAGYAVWRLLQAVLDTEHKGESVSGMVERIGFAIAAVTYAGLAVSGLGMALARAGGPNDEQATQDRTAWLMSQPFGPWLVVAAGLIVVGVGLAQFVRAYRASFADKLQRDEMSSSTRRVLQVAGRLGFSARGIAFVLIGAFLVVAGTHAEPDQARGLGGALAALSGQPLGPWLLALVGLGLMAYGVYMLVAARYRRMVLS